MDQGLRVFAALLECPSSIPSIHLRWLKLSLTPASGNLMPPFQLACTCKHVCKHIHINTHTHKHKEKPFLTGAITGCRCSGQVTQSQPCLCLADFYPQVCLCNSGGERMVISTTGSKTDRWTQIYNYANKCEHALPTI